MLQEQKYEKHVIGDREGMTHMDQLAEIVDKLNPGQTVEVQLPHLPLGGITMALIPYRQVVTARTPDLRARPVTAYVSKYDRNEAE